MSWFASLVSDLNESVDEAFSTPISAEKAETDLAELTTAVLLAALEPKTPPSKKPVARMLRVDDDSDVDDDGDDGGNHGNIGVDRSLASPPPPLTARPHDAEAFFEALLPSNGGVSTPKKSSSASSLSQLGRASARGAVSSPGASPIAPLKSTNGSISSSSASTMSSTAKSIAVQSNAPSAELATLQKLLDSERAEHARVVRKMTDLQTEEQLSHARALNAVEVAATQRARDLGAQLDEANAKWRRADESVQKLANDDRVQRAAIDEANALVAQLRAAAAARDDERAQLETQLEQLRRASDNRDGERAQREALDEALARARRADEALERLKVSGADERAALEKQVDKHAAQERALTDSLADAQSQLARTAIDLESANATVASLRTRANDLQIQLGAKINESLAAAEQATQVRDAASDELVTLRNDVDALRSERDDALRATQTLAEQRVTDNKRFADQRAALESKHTAELTRASASAAELATQYAAEQARVHQRHQAALDELRADCERRLRDERDAVQERISETAAAAASAAEVVAREALDAQIEDVKAARAAAERELVDARAATTSVRAELDAALAQRADAQAHADALEAQLEKLRADEIRASTAASAAAPDDGELERLRGAVMQMSQVSAQLNNANIELERMRAENTRLRGGNQSAVAAAAVAPTLGDVVALARRVDWKAMAHAYGYYGIVTIFIILALIVLRTR
jgi:chromosome segregation ATPase